MRIKRENRAFGIDTKVSSVLFITLCFVTSYAPLTTNLAACLRPAQTTKQPQISGVNAAMP